MQTVILIPANVEAAKTIAAHLVRFGYEFSFGYERTIAVDPIFKIPMGPGGDAEAFADEINIGCTAPYITRVV